LISISEESAFDAALRIFQGEIPVPWTGLHPVRNFAVNPAWGQRLLDCEARSSIQLGDADYAGSGWHDRSPACNWKWAESL